MFDFLRNLTKSDEEKEQEKLSAYLDDNLTPQERLAFEEQLKADTALQSSLEQQRLIKQNLSALPRVRAPRNFTLDPALYGRPTPSALFNLYPVMRTATALAAIVLIFLFSLDLFSSTGLESDTVAQAPVTTSGEAANVVSEAESAVEEAAQAAEPNLFNADEDEFEAAEEAMDEAPAEEEAEESEEAIEEEMALPAEAEVMLEEVDPAAGGAADAAGYPYSTTRESDVASDGEAGLYMTVIPPLTSTELISETSTVGRDLGDDLNGDSQANAEGGDRSGLVDDSRMSTRQILQIMLGVLFLALLTGTWLIRRQL